MRPDNERQTPVDVRLQELRRRVPSGPDFSQATLEYTNLAINAVIEKVTNTLEGQFPESKDEINEWGQTHRGRSPDFRITSVYEKIDGKVMIHTSQDSLYKADLLNQAVYAADPQLGRLSYITSTYIPRTNREREEKRHPGFPIRFNRLVQAAGLPVDSAPAKIWGVALMTQIAKNKAVDETKQLLETGSVFSGVAEEKYRKSIQEKLGEKIDSIHHHRGFIARGLHAIDEIALQADLSPENLQLLMDMAFLSNKGVLTKDKFSEMLDPIARAVGRGTPEGWEEAKVLRDFLLRYFASTFPAWRIREQQKEEDDSVLYKRMTEVKTALIQGEITLTSMNIPDAYYDSIMEMLGSAGEQGIKRQDIEFIKESLGITQEIFTQLAHRTKLLEAIEHLPDDFRDEHSQSIIKFIESVDRLVFKRFLITYYLNQLKEKYPEINFEKTREEILSVGNSWRNYVRTPEISSIGEITASPDGRHINTLMVKREIISSGRIMHGQYPEKFSAMGLLLDVINASYTSNPGRLVLPKDMVKRALWSAYRSKCPTTSDGKFYKFSLSEYLKKHFASLKEQEGESKPMSFLEQLIAEIEEEEEERAIIEKQEKEKQGQTDTVT